MLPNMQRVIGPLPGKKTRVSLDERVEKVGKYVGKKLTPASAPGEETPADLLIASTKQVMPSSASRSACRTTAGLPAQLASRPAGRGTNVGAGRLTNAERRPVQAWTGRRSVRQIAVKNPTAWGSW